MPGLDTLSDLQLLAQPSAWRNLGTRFSGEHLQWQREDVIGLFVLALVLVGGLWLLHWLAAWQADQSSRHSPRRLVRELDSAHGLSYRERRLCREIAAEQRLDDPAELFVRIEVREALAKRDRGLAERLFGEA